MNRCAAVKRRGSTEPCTSRSLRGHTLCGRHARMRSPTLWTDANGSRIESAVKIQALIRGWLIRRRLWYAGPGVLYRRDLANDEDVITCADRNRVHPMDFFSFVENGKVWWFEFASLWTWCRRNQDPVNPYTKVPLSSEARKRLRTIWGYKRRHREEIPEESNIYDERLRQKLNILTQHFADYGFTDVYPDTLIRYSKAEYITLFVLLHRDIETVIPESDPFRNRIASLCAARTFVDQNRYYILQCINTLLHIVTLYKDPYVITFSILSAFYRA